MNTEEGHHAGQCLLDALAMLTEHEANPSLIAVSVTVVALDESDQVVTCCQTWARESED